MRRLSTSDIFIELLWDSLVEASNRPDGLVRMRVREGEGQIYVPIDARGLPMGTFDPLGDGI